MCVSGIPIIPKWPVATMLGILAFPHLGCSSNAVCGSCKKWGRSLDFSGDCDWGFYSPQRHHQHHYLVSILRFLLAPGIQLGEKKKWFKSDVSWIRLKWHEVTRILLSLMIVRFEATFMSYTMRYLDSLAVSEDVSSVSMTYGQEILDAPAGHIQPSIFSH